MSISVRRLGLGLTFGLTVGWRLGRILADRSADASPHPNHRPAHYRQSPILRRHRRMGHLPQSEASAVDALCLRGAASRSRDALGRHHRGARRERGGQSGAVKFVSEHGGRSSVELLGGTLSSERGRGRCDATSAAAETETYPAPPPIEALARHDRKLLALSRRNLPTFKSRAAWPGLDFANWRRSIRSLPTSAVRKPRRASSQPSEHSLHVLHGRLIVEAVKRGTGLHAVPNFDFRCLMVIGHRVTMPIDGQPQNIRWSTFMSSNLDRVWIGPPDDPARSASAIAFTCPA